MRIVEIFEGGWLRWVGKLRLEQVIGVLAR
jgi:hypothetical protein